MILAVTMNPSVDISYPLNEFKLDDVNRVEDVSKTAGGKGLNVARVISQMEREVLATGILGGTIGDYIVKELENDQIKNDFLKTDKESRNCIAILHEGKQTEILEAGPTLSEKEGQDFLNKFKNLLDTVSMVTISGSLPKGLPNHFYQSMLEMSHKNNIPVILDSSGESLKQTLLHDKKPFVIKPNLTELEQLLGSEVKKDVISLKAAVDNSLFEGVAWVVVSMGSEGAFVKHFNDYYQVAIPKIEVVNPVGSGDATVAGLAAALEQEEPDDAVLKTAMTVGMLNTMENGTGHIDFAQFDQYFELVEVTKLNE